MGGGKTNLNNASFGRKKTIKGIVIGAILGTIITGGIGVTAVTLTAEQIKYTPSNEKFTATNVQEAMDEIYKIAEYKIPEDTYFYEQDTEGDSSTIVRYKKINGEYYICNAYGVVDDGTLATDVSAKTLIPYTATSAENLMAGSAGYASNNIILGESSSMNQIGSNLYFEKYEGTLPIGANSSITISASKLSKVIGIYCNARWTNTYKVFMMSEMVDSDGVNYGSISTLPNDLTLTAIDDTTMRINHLYNVYNENCTLSEIYLVGYL